MRTAQYMHLIYTKHAQNTLKTCIKHTQTMLKAYSKHALNMLKTCIKHAQSMHQTCTKDAQDMYQDLLGMLVRKSPLSRRIRCASMWASFAAGPGCPPTSRSTPRWPSPSLDPCARVCRAQVPSFATSLPVREGPVHTERGFSRKSKAQDPEVKSILPSPWSPPSQPCPQCCVRRPRSDAAAGTAARPTWWRRS